MIVLIKCDATGIANRIAFLPVWTCLCLLTLPRLPSIATQTHQLQDMPCLCLLLWTCLCLCISSMMASMMASMRTWHVPHNHGSSGNQMICFWSRDMLSVPHHMPSALLPKESLHHCHMPSVPCHSTSLDKGALGGLSVVVVVVMVVVLVVAHDCQQRDRSNSPNLLLGHRNGNCDVCTCCLTNLL